MENFKLYDGEMKFMSIVWENEPLSSRRLVELCSEKLGWKQSTTYTVLKKLSLKGLTKNENSTVTSIIKREQVQRFESQAVVDKAFGGSLPGFVAAFMSGRQLSDEDADALLSLIDKYRGERNAAD